MNNIIHPSTVCFSYNQERDDQSELTVDNDIVHQKESTRGIKLGADPYFYHSLDRSRHPLPGNSHQHQQELYGMKLKIARQEEKLDMLSSKLSQCQVENEILQSENATLVNELASSSSSSPPTNRLQVINSVMRKSFKKYITDSRRRENKDKEIIKNLRCNIEVLQQQQQKKYNSKPPLRKSVGSGTGTATTSLETGLSGYYDNINTSLRSIPTINSSTIPEEEHDEWIIEGVDIVEAENEKAMLSQTFTKVSDCKRKGFQEMLLRIAETRGTRPNIVARRAA